MKMTVVDGVMMHTCEICGAHFKRESEVERHRSGVHGLDAYGAPLRRLTTPEVISRFHANLNGKWGIVTDLQICNFARSVKGEIRTPLSSQTLLIQRVSLPSGPGATEEWVDEMARTAYLGFIQELLTIILSPFVNIPATSSVSSSKPGNPRRKRGKTTTSGGGVEEPIPF